MNYNEFVDRMETYKAYKQSQDQLEAELEAIWYEMAGVKAVRYDKQPATFNPSIVAEIRSNYSEQVEEKQKELDATISAIWLIEKDLNRLPDDIQMICHWKYIDHLTFEQIGKIMGYSGNAIWNRLKKEVEKI